VSFAHLGLLAAGLAGVSIPIIIHLLMRRRRKPLMWGAMRFLLEAYRRQRRRLMIEQWVLLATRCLVVLLVALAIGRPVLEGLIGGGAGRTVFIVVDNGLAASARGADGSTALERHKRSAARLLERLAGSGAQADRVALITAGAPAEAVVLPPSADAGAVARLVDAIEATDAATDLPGALALVAGALAPPGAGGGAAGGGPETIDPQRSFVVVLSEFGEGSAELSSALPRLPGGVRVIASEPAASLGANVGIASLEPLRSVVIAEPGRAASGGDQLVRARLVRGDSSAEQVGTLRVSLASSTRDAGMSGRANYRLSAGQDEVSVSVALAPGGTDVLPALPAGFGVLRGEIDADAIVGDNSAVRPVQTRAALRVGVMGAAAFASRSTLDELDGAEWLRLALAPTEGGAVEVQSVEPSALDVTRLATMDALVVARPDLLGAEQWRPVRSFADSGGLVVITAPADVSVHLWADAAGSELGLGWGLAREAMDLGPAGLSPTGPSPRGAEDVPDLLEAVRPELGGLSESVRVFKILPPQLANGRALLALPDGRPLVWVSRPGAGGEGKGAPGSGLVVYLAAAPELSWTDLPAKPLMIALMQEIVRQGVGQARGSWTATAGRVAAAPTRAVELRRIGATAGDAEAGVLRVGATGLTTEPIRRAGLFSATDDRGGVRGLVAVNADAKGGRLAVQPRAQVESWLNGILTQPAEPIAWVDAGAKANEGAGGASATSSWGGLLGNDRSGPPISVPLLAAALALAVFETWLARRASHAEAGVDTLGTGAAALGRAA
jgi:hypothetical protein